MMTSDSAFKLIRYVIFTFNASDLILIIFFIVAATSQSFCADCLSAIWISSMDCTSSSKFIHFIASRQPETKKEATLSRRAQKSLSRIHSATKCDTVFSEIQSSALQDPSDARWRFICMILLNKRQMHFPAVKVVVGRGRKRHTSSARWRDKANERHFHSKRQW